MLGALMPSLNELALDLANKFSGPEDSGYTRVMGEYACRAGLYPCDLHPLVMAIWQSRLPPVYDHPRWDERPIPVPFDHPRADEAPGFVAAVAEADVEADAPVRRARMRMPGVAFCKDRSEAKQWRAGITVGRRLYTLGYYATEWEAHQRYLQEKKLQEQDKQRHALLRSMGIDIPNT